MRMWKRDRLNRKERRKFETLVQVFFEAEPYDPDQDDDSGDVDSPGEVALGSVPTSATRLSEASAARPWWWLRRPH